MGENGDSGRPVRDLQGLLRLAVEHTPIEQDDSSQRARPLDPERRQFLEEALSSMSVNVTEEMKKSLEVLVKPGETEEEVTEKERAIDELLDLVDNIDFANDFHKIGGFNILLPGLQSNQPSLRSKTAELIAELMQNNPYCQKAAIDCHLVPTLLHLVDSDVDDIVRIKGLYALSCLLRDNPDAQTEFCDKDGFSVLMRAMQSDITKVKVKASFLLSKLCSEHPAYKDIVCSMGFVEQLVALLQREGDGSLEHVLSALYAVACDHLPSITECQRGQLGLKDTLNQHIRQYRSMEERREEVEYCKWLLDICFDENDNNEAMIAR